MDLSLFNTPLTTGTNAHKTGINIFWNNMSGGGVGCWLWKGPFYPNKYGRFNFRGKYYIASRIAYQLYHNKVLPDDVNVCHTCDNPPCCNPYHLFEGTQQDNINDASEKGKFTDNPNFGKGRRVLSNEDVKTIREKYLSGKYTQKQLASIFAVRQNCISRIVNHKRRQPLKKLFTLALLAIACAVGSAQTSKPILKLKSFAAPAGSTYTSILVNWQFTPNAPPCPTSGVLSNCIAGFNTTITLGGTTVYSATAGYGAGQLSPSALTYTYTPVNGVSFGNYTITVTTAGFDGSGNAIFSTPASTTLAVNLTAISPPTNVTATGK